MYIQTKNLRAWTELKHYVTRYVPLSERNEFPSPEDPPFRLKYANGSADIDLHLSHLGRSTLKTHGLQVWSGMLARG